MSNKSNPEQVSAYYRIGDIFLLDTRLHTLTNEDTSEMTELSLNESLLLQLLIKEKGEIVSRQQILADVWEPRGLVVDESSVNQSISLLRKAFNDNAKDQMVIKTIPKMGYLLVLEANPCEVMSPSESVAENSHQASMGWGPYLAVVLLAFVAAWFAVEKPQASNMEAIESASIPIPIYKLAGNQINPKLVPVIERCVNVIVEQENKPVSKALVAANHADSISLLIFHEQSLGHAFRIGLNSSLLLEENQCQL
ncbi:Transcriptional activator CadC [Grimontia celer]|uniref:Transcriptional activator CadC n=1 Tax=Grimontia celer TaxID=1796497 RepID=A0A128EZZ3_9GAMM|nr:winged helix-turn-helix domain-containing protein [Grimontia celer]CZF79855.1 Transcriptional activator CadC [Grimontia celer]